jgi:hypothetical protein
MRLSHLVLLCFAAGASARAATVELQLSSATVVAGNTFTLDVRAINLGASTVVTFGMNPYTSDPAKVSFVSAVVDPLFFDDSGFFGGNPAIAGDTFPPAGPGPITLATLTFRALQVGTVSVGVTSDLADPNQGLGLNGPAPDFLPSTVDLTSFALVQVVPEPSTVALLLAGIGALWICRPR